MVDALDSKSSIARCARSSRARGTKVCIQLLISLASDPLWTAFGMAANAYRANLGTFEGAGRDKRCVVVKRAFRLTGVACDNTNSRLRERLGTTRGASASLGSD